MFNNFIFDLDNTLYNYDLCNNLAIKEVFFTISKSYNMEENIIYQIFKNSKKKHHNTVINQASSHNKCIQIKKILEDLNLPLNDLYKLYELYIEIFIKNLKLYDNVEDFLILCKKKYINCYILTNNICYEQIKKLNKLNVLKYFKKIYTSEELGVEKPDIKTLYYILQENNIEINDVAMIGDSFKNDIQCANLVSMYGFLFNNSNLKFNKTYCEFKNFKELYDFFNNYYIELNKFIKLSKYCGERYDLVQAGGGNISFKLDNLMFIKSSGCILSDININKNYVCINKDYILENIIKINSLDKKTRETESKSIVKHSKIFLKKYKPSIETIMHCLTKKYTIHLHPLQFLKICGYDNCLELLSKKFKNICFIDYFTPGIDVALEINKKYLDQNIIFLKNHGIVLTSDNIEELYNIMKNTINNLESIVQFKYDKYKVTNYVSELMNKFSSNLTTSYLITNPEIIKLYFEKKNLHPYFPDKVVYCGIDIFNLEYNNNDFENIKNYIDKYQELPKLFLFNENIYINSISLKKCIEIESVFKSHLLCYDKNNITLSNDEITYLNNWESEKFRKLT